MSQDPIYTQGSISGGGNILYLDNGLVEDISLPGEAPQYLIVSYDASAPDGSASKGMIRLIITDNTVIINPFGIQVKFQDIQLGTYINAQISSNLTGGSPPESHAYLIVVQKTPTPTESLVTTDWVAFVEADTGLIYTGNPRSINSQKRFVISNATQITDQYGNAIPLSAIPPGQIVQITHSPFHTGCLPPQATAYATQLL
ncbi:MAG: hypothetical protein ACRDBO_03390 [Lachnospiraceae bacterium]